MSSAIYVPTSGDSTGSSSGTARGPLMFLERTGSVARRRLLTVLLVSLPLWIYVTTWDILVMLFQSALGHQGVGILEVVERVLIRLPLLPLLIGAYLVAVNIRLWPHRRIVFGVEHLVVALAFSAMIRPVLVASYYAVNRAFGTRLDIAKLVHDLMPWQYWVASTIQYTIVYVLGLVLIISVNVFLRFRSEQLRAAHLHSKWLESRLSTLRAQLDPHFFFNAVNIIVALIHRDPDRAERLLTELAGLLRRSLAEGAQAFTTVRDELRFLERYLEIMKARYEDRLSVVVSVDPDMLDDLVPSFLLVPLVENAVKHGVAAAPGDNTVEVRGRRDGSVRVFTVKNRIRIPGTARKNTAGGLGLSNIRRRLSAIYGARFRLRSAADANGGWTAAVEIPEETVGFDSNLAGAGGEPASTTL